MDNICFIDINQQNLHLLISFIEKIGTSNETFRYFNNRGIEAILNHKATLIILNNNELAAYGHLDYENNIDWLGICVLPNYLGKGYGKLMMQRLFDKARIMNLKSIYLTVDKVNNTAISLYKKFNFQQIEETETYLKFIAYI